MKLRRVFLLSFTLAAISVVGLAAFDDYRKAIRRDALFGHRLIGNVSVRQQMQLSELVNLKAAGFRTVIDFRPDGEAKDQPSSDAFRAEAARLGLRFYYLPTPHGVIEDDTVAKYAATMTPSDESTMLFCRSGSRAARVWALAQASRPNGPDAGSIINAVRSAGLDASDLQPRIEIRIAGRTRQD